PLFRIGVIELNSGYQILMMDMHHIISDGVSLQVLCKDFIRLYGGERLPIPELAYKDYAEWWNADEQQDLIKKQEAYWLERFRGFLPSLELPLDFKRPELKRFEGTLTRFQLDPDKTEKFKAIAKKAGATLYMIILSTYFILLSRLSGNEDVVIGTLTAGRARPDVRQMIGMFVNTLAIRSFPSGDKTFEEFLSEVKHDILNDFENQDYPFENLVRNVVREVDFKRNPLFDAFFILENIDYSVKEGEALKLTVYPFKWNTTQFDLHLFAWEADRQLSFVLTSATTLFRQDTIDSFITSFEQIISSVLENPQRKISEIETVPVGERVAMMAQFTDDLENEF
ncbi:MAG: non-ribosomal peptide synthetase, partial [bacterium]|nr:non-ribosomal peptide synthetase [bacterium]